MLRICAIWKPTTPLHKSFVNAAPSQFISMLRLSYSPSYSLSSTSMAGGNPHYGAYRKRQDQITFQGLYLSGQKLYSQSQICANNFCWEDREHRNTFSLLELFRLIYVYFEHKKTVLERTMSFIMLPSIIQSCWLGQYPNFLSNKTNFYTGWNPIFRF